jgi:OPA family glycerol-3-phosphate transporter-like MFS transporter/OPA family sugar phosphate sensor protein UhpC-like MFS transporter
MALVPTTTTTTETVALSRRTGLLAIFQPDPAAPVTITDPQRVAAEYRRWQVKVLVWSIVGYALFYFVRKNLSVAMPVMGKELGIGKQQLGLFLTLHGVLYGVSKFANGYLGDRANARVFMAVGLILSAITNLVFGLSSAVIVFGLVWMLNGWFQGMGFPPCARLMTHWFPPKELATKMSIWNTSHSIGAGAIVVLCGYLVDNGGAYGWRLCFLVPAALAIVGAVVMFFTLPDTPTSVGLPEVAGTKVADDGARADDTADTGSAALNDETPKAAEDLDFNAFVRRHVFGNYHIWILALANFFVYTVRYAVLDWGPTLLNESKHIKLASAGWMVAAFELSGLVGILSAGWITDNVFGGRGARTCLFCMLGVIGSVLLLWQYPGNSVMAYTVILCVAGFFIYGPQALIGITAANLATKRAAATAVGFTGIFGYASTVLSGVGLGWVVQHYGWDRGFLGMLVVAIAGAVVLAFAWRAKPHGYAETATH